MVDKAFCMSSFLMYRYVYDSERWFSDRKPCSPVSLDFDRVPVRDCQGLQRTLFEIVSHACEDGKAALALSGGIDSAILARMVPAGTKAYTFRCVVPGIQVVDESQSAASWAKMNHLEHEVIDITWEDAVTAAELCMKSKGAPVHSIEAQIYLASQKAVQDGHRRFLFGENADIIYGGMDGLLAKDWLFGEFVERYSYLLPYRVLRNPEMPLEPFQRFEREGRIDAHQFINCYFRQEALGTYQNACTAAGIEFVGPYSLTRMDRPIDYARIRSGEPKYLIRELFQKLYPGEDIPQKIPMPRPVKEWLAGWAGPNRPEFLPHCADHLTGNQRWMIWSLERFLDLMER